MTDSVRLFFQNTFISDRSATDFCFDSQLNKLLGLFHQNTDYCVRMTKLSLITTELFM